MGTQQILLIVVGVIIVGIAIVVGTIPAFHRGMTSANRDAITQDLMRYAAAAQGYFRRPTIYAGGGNSYNEIQIEDVGLERNGGGFGQNQNGEYDIDGSAGKECVLIGYSNYVPGATVTVIVGAGYVNDPIYDGWDD